MNDGVASKHFFQYEHPKGIVPLPSLVGAKDLLKPHQNLIPALADEPGRNKTATWSYPNYLITIDGL